MQFPLNITFRDMDSSPALEDFVRQWADKLDHVYDRIERCDVTIERPHQHQRHGQRIHVRVVVAIPGPDLAVTRDPTQDGSHEDAYVAIRDAFRAARRQLVEHVHRLRHEVKTHVEPSA